MLKKFLAGVASFSLVVLGVVGVSGVAYADVVNIPDKNLAACINSTLGQPSGTTISNDDLAVIAGLNCEDKNIKDLTGLEKAIALRYIYASDNEISDVSALSGLTNLTALYLGANQVSDVSALGGLTNLTTLYLYDNQVSDVSALSGLTNLTRLYLGSNQVSDVSALSGLTNLTTLYLNDNQVSDVSALSGLTNLTSLDTDWNKISDFRPVSHVPSDGLRVDSQKPVVYVPMPSAGNPSKVDFVFYEADGTTRAVNLDGSNTDFGVTKSGTTLTFSCTPVQCKKLTQDTPYRAAQIDRPATSQSELWVIFTSPKSEPDSEPGSKPDSEPDSEPGSKPDSEPDSEPGSKPDSKPDSEPGSKTESKVAVQKPGLARTGAASDSLLWLALMLTFGGVTTVAMRRHV